MEMSEDDIGDLRRVDPQSLEIFHEPSRPPGSGMWAQSGIDECQAVPAAHEEPAHLDGQHPIRVEELGVL